jgi:AraC-like DNA-binding protein
MISLSLLHRSQFYCIIVGKTIRSGALVSDIKQRSIVKIGTTKWRLTSTALRSEGIRSIEYHRHGCPDLYYRRLPMPWITLVITLGTVGEWRAPGGTWQPFPRFAVRGHGGRWTEGRDDPTGESEYLTAIIDPLAFHSIGDVPVAPVVGRFLSAADLPRLDRRLDLDHLNDCSTPAAKMLALADALATRSENRNGTAVSNFAGTALQRGISVGGVAKEIGCSERHLRQRFINDFGLSPKAWQRLSRFASSLKMLHPQFVSPKLDPEDAFFDQSHFIHDFRHFSGTTPRDYARQKSRGDPRLFLTS